MSAEMVSTLGLLLCLAPAVVHGVEVISPMLSRWVVNLVLLFFGPGFPAANAPPALTACKRSESSTAWASAAFDLMAFGGA